MLSDELKAKIEAVKLKLLPLQNEMSGLERELDDARSREWIAANGVTLEDVQPCSGDGIPWHFHLDEFAKWMRRTGCKKRWCEWNGTIYSTAEILAGGMPRYASGRIEHVKELVNAD